MQSVMVEKVFYGVPHKLGWFEHSHVGMFQKHEKAVEAAHKDADAEKMDETKGVEMTVKSPDGDAPQSEKLEEVE